MTGELMPDCLADRAEIRDLIEIWVLCRDARQWDRFRTPCCAGMSGVVAGLGVRGRACESVWHFWALCCFVIGMHAWHTGGPF